MAALTLSGTATYRPHTRTSRFLVCEKWPFRIRTKMPPGFALTILKKLSSHCVKVCACFYPDKWHAGLFQEGNTKHFWVPSDPEKHDVATRTHACHQGTIFCEYKLTA